MAEASPTLSSPASPAIAAAAAEIVALINSRPTSPRQEEIEAIIAPLNGPREEIAPAGLPPLASTALRGTYVASAWHQALSAYFEECGRTSADEDLDALDERLDDSMNAILAKPVRTFDDLVVRAAMAVHWNEDRLSDPYPDHVMNSKKACSDDRALAAVVRGVLDLAGLKFDAEGRLLAARRKGQ